MIGDVISDAYRDCTFKKMCPDVPEVKALVTNSVDVRPGGAANVAVNIAALAPDARVYLIGAVGAAHHQLARRIKQQSHNRVNMDFCPIWDPLIKERVIQDGQVLIRLDNMSQMPTMAAEDIENHLKDFMAQHDPDLILLSDYGSGSVNETSLEILLNARERLLVDTKMTDLSIFGSGGRKTRMVKLNDLEWKAVIEHEAAPERFFEAMVTTRGDLGAVLKCREEFIGGRKTMTHTLRVPAHDVVVEDVCGCGDTFLAGLGASLLQSDDYFSAVQFANAASATVVSKARTSVADLGLTLEMLGRKE